MSNRSFWFRCIFELLSSLVITTDLQDESFLNETALNIILDQTLSEIGKHPKPLFPETPRFTPQPLIIKARDETGILNHSAWEGKRRRDPCEVAAELLTSALQLFFSYTTTLTSSARSTPSGSTSPGRLPPSSAPPIDFERIRSSPEFRKFTKATAELQTISLSNLSEGDLTSFFVNVYNLMVIHGEISVGFPTSLLEFRYFTRYITYHIGSLPFSLDCIHRILRGKTARGTCVGDYAFSPTDPRMDFMLSRLDPRLHFLLCWHNRSSPPIRIVSTHNLEDHLEAAAVAYCASQVVIDVEGRCVTLSMLFDWYEEDFQTSVVGEGEQEEGVLLGYIQAWLSPDQKTQITQLVEEGPVYEIGYVYDWTPNPPLV